MVGDAVEGAGADEGFDGAAVDEALVDPAAEVEEVAEGAAGAAFGDDGVDRLFAGALDGAEAVADFAARDGPLRRS